MASQEPDAACTEALTRERALLDPRVRRDPAAVRALLHPAFQEYGASGRCWTRDTMVSALAQEDPNPVVLVEELHGVRLACSVVLVTYLVDRSGRRTRHSSVWVCSEDGEWLLRFHQGTPAPAP